MARNKGSANLAASLEVLAGAPLDARQTVATKADLTAEGSFPYTYVGMETYVVAENKKYRFIGIDPTDIEDWEEVGSGGGGSYTAGDGILIENDEISTDNMQEGDMDDVIYKTPSGGGGGGQIIQYEELPTASAENVGKIVQYIGADDDPLVNGYYYECVSDGEDPATYSWVQKNVQPSGGSGGGSTTKVITAAIDVGGIEAGTSYPIDTPLEDIISNLLEPTLYPTLTDPSASITYGANQYYAVGATVNAMTATVALNRGSINPAYGTSGYRSGVATGYAIATVGADTEYTDSSESSGAFSVPTLTRATKGTIVVTGTASYAAGEQPKDSKGNDYESPLVAGSKSTSKTLTFIQPYYYGASNTSTISDFTGLTANVTAKGQKTFNYTTNNQHMVFAYDSSYGNLKTILDGNGFDVTGGWTKSIVTVDGFSYFVYVSNSPTTDTNAPFTFKY